ncbi:MAG: tryptophan 7-halogenase [Planctomycetota bacterium]
MQYDVLILGSGLGGTVTASILAKKGWRVLLIDSASHPRFAIGEATTPDISFLMKVLSKKYEIPELLNLTTFHKLRDHVSSACGIKKSFSFLYHNEGEVHTPEQSHQFPTLAPPFGPDCHLFRQDTDAYMMAVALDYGADIRQQTRVEEIEFGPEGVVLTTCGGEEIRGRFLIDGAGFRSPVAKKFGLRETPCRLKAHSRTLFTHMIGVEHYQEVGGSPRNYGHAYRFSEGTLHHMFAEGWMWVIPFNNHNDATNQLCSVGVLLDSNKCPKPTDMSPEEEFQSLIARFPSISDQFKNARAVRDWVSTDRLQYSSSDIVGDRYCLLAHAGGFIDPLYSTGLNLTMSLIDDLVTRLDQSLKADRFEKADFDFINDEFQEKLDYCDRMVANSFRAFQNYDLWDAWYRVWVVGNFSATAMNINLYLNYEQTSNRDWLDRTDDAPYSGILGSRLSANRELFERADALMQAFERGEKSASEAADGIRKVIEDADYFPSYWKFHDKEMRSTPTFTVPDITRMYMWFVLYAPKEIRKDLMGSKLSGVFTYTLKSIRDHRSRANSRKRLIRDALFSAQ